MQTNQRQIVVALEKNDTVVAVEKTDSHVVAVGVMGPTGPTGPQGPQGDTGPQGAPGPSGASTTTLTAGAALSGHRIVVSSSLASGEVLYGSNDSAADARLVLGMTTGAASSGSSIDVVHFGEITEPSWSWTLGMPIYLGTNGYMTQTAPTSPTALFSMVVAFPISPTSIFVSIREPIFLI